MELQASRDFLCVILVLLVQRKPRNMSSKDTRMKKVQGSRKINFSCISQIKVIIDKSISTVTVVFCKTHYGHDFEIKHLTLPREERANIAQRLVLGVSTTKILDTYREAIDERKLKRIDIITRKDINNVKSSYNIQIQEGVRHSIGILTSEAIQCYKCVFAHYVYNDNTFLCKDFDYSEKFIVDCPYSTLCLKKNAHAQINGVQINSTDRDCAAQRVDTQELKNGKWYALQRIEEPYSEGCKSTDDKGFRMPGIEHCYCRGDLCNSGNTVYGTNRAVFYRTLTISALSALVSYGAVKLTIL